MWPAMKLMLRQDETCMGCAEGKQGDRDGERPQAFPPGGERGREKEWEGCISGCRKAPKLLARPIGFTCCLIDKVS